MVNINELEIQTAEGTANWTATSPLYPEYIGVGLSEEGAKQSLVDQINGANHGLTYGEEGTGTSLEG